MSKRILIICLLLRAAVASSQTLDANGGEISSFSPGYAYTLQPIPASDTAVSPRITGAEWNEPMMFFLSAAPGDVYRVSFSLLDLDDPCGGSITSALYASAL